MPNAVTNRQIFYLLFITLTTGSLITASQSMAVSAGHGAWISLLVTALIFGAVAAMMARLSSLYPGETLYEYSGRIFGKAAACVLTGIYILYFSAFSSHLCYSFFALVKANFLTESPEWALLLFTMPFLGIIAYEGITNVGRLAVVVGVLFLVVSLIFFATMFIEGHLNYIRPLLIKREVGRDFLAAREAFDFFTGIAVLTIIPITPGNKRPSGAVFLFVLLIGVFYVLSVYGSYAMIGMDENKYHKYPLLDAIRQIRYMKIQFLQRVDILYMTLGFMRVFVAKSVVYLVVVELLCKVLPKAKRGLVVLFTGIVFYGVDIAAFAVPDMGDRFPGIMALFSVFTVFVIPLTLYITAKVKKSG